MSNSSLIDFFGHFACTVTASTHDRIDLLKLNVKMQTGAEPIYTGTLKRKRKNHIKTRRISTTQVEVMYKWMCVSWMGMWQWMLEVQSQERHTGTGGQCIVAPHRVEGHCTWVFQFLRQEHVFDINATKHCVLLNYFFWFFAQKITLLLLFDHPGRHLCTEKQPVK